MERTLDIHQTITLAPPPSSGPDTEVDPLGRRNTPIGGDASTAHMHAALAASNRTDESLNALMRAIQELSRGVGGARLANEHLVSELETLRVMLGGANEQQLALRNRLTLLEQERQGDRKRATAENSFLQEQYDAFLADLLGEHEQATEELRRERDAAHKRIAELEARLLAVSAHTTPGSKPTLRSEGTPAPEQATKTDLAQLKSTVERLTQERERTREALQRLQVQRDEAQAQAAKAIRERDAVQAEADRAEREAGHPQRAFSVPRPSASQTGIPLSARRTDPPPKGASQPPVIRRPVLELELDVGPSPRRTSPAPSSQPPRTSRPPIKTKPDPISRPLIGYSVKDSVAPESLGSSPRQSKPPKP